MTQLVKSKSTTVTETFDADGKLIERSTDEYVEYADAPQTLLAPWQQPLVTNSAISASGGYPK